MNQTGLIDGTTCKSPDNVEGSCTVLKECPRLKQMMEVSRRFPLQREFLQKSLCKYVGKKAFVCCTADDYNVSRSDIPNFVDNSKSAINHHPEWLVKLKEKVPESPECGYSLEERIFGGYDAAINEFPWTVLIEYRKCKKINFFSFEMYCELDQS